MAGIRKSIGKATRFRIFARDGYTCRYCGSTPPNVVLVIDHMHPVAEGGGNDDANLITSCRDCNAGKGKKLLGTIAPTEEDGRRIAQEYAEQVDVANMAAKATAARQSIRESMYTYWVTASGREPSVAFVTLMCNLVDEFGHNTVISWLDITANKELSQMDSMRYLAGIARNTRERNEKPKQEQDEPSEPTEDGEYEEREPVATREYVNGYRTGLEDALEVFNHIHRDKWGSFLEAAMAVSYRVSAPDGRTTTTAMSQQFKEKLEYIFGVVEWEDVA